MAGVKVTLLHVFNNMSKRRRVSYKTRYGKISFLAKEIKPRILKRSDCKRIAPCNPDISYYYCRVKCPERSKDCKHIRKGSNNVVHHSTRRKKEFSGVLFSSINSRWQTPSDLYKILDKEFKFDYDPCPSNPKVNGLITSWKERNYINPPYNKITRWLHKGFYQAKEGRLCVFLLPSRTDTYWWHRYVLKSKEIRFIRGRLKFGGSDHSAPFPSCVVIFDGRK